MLCVFFPADIRDDGQVKIHFDGWNSGNYDYYTDFSSSDLHPVGWMSMNNRTYKSKLNPELQAPKGNTCVTLGQNVLLVDLRTLLL